MIDDPDTDIVIIDAELPKAPHELRERNLRIVNDMAGAASKPVVYISAMSIGFTEFTKVVACSIIARSMSTTSSLVLKMPSAPMPPTERYAKRAWYWLMFARACGPISKPD